MGEDFIKWLLETHGPTGAAIAYIIWSNNKSTHKRAEARDVEFAALEANCLAKCEANENSITKHIKRHENFESEIKRESAKTRDEMKQDVGKLYEELKPISRSVSKIEGYMEAMQQNKGDNK